MSSVPQGWHGIPVPTRNSQMTSMSAASTVPTIIRKKWNSPLSSEVPPSKLPSYKPSSVRLQKSAVKNTLSTRSSSKSQVDLTSTPTKSSPTKELKNDIAKLKKELATIKTENSILKVKVRRVDDENIQKSKQIEKLRVELKAAQKSEVASSKKSKESELLLLRQKCLRLECALKEKDAIIKKLRGESPLKSAETDFSTQEVGKETSDNDDSKQQTSYDSKLGKKYSATRSALSRTTQSSKGEVTKLRDMIHKLEKENQDLQQQVKEKGDEVRRLKVHLRSQTYTKSTAAPIAKSISKSIKSSEPSSTATSLSKSVAKTNSYSSRASGTLTLPGKIQRGKTVEKTTIMPSSSKTTLSQKSVKQIPKITENQEKKVIGKSNKALNSSKLQPRPVPKKQVNGLNSKLPVNKATSSLTVTKPAESKYVVQNLMENNIEEQTERMRKNIAAKRIQRSWRSHRKQISVKKEPDNIEKAMTFIVTSLKYHKMRKEKLNFVGRQKHIIPKLKEDKESAIVDAIRAATKTLWEKEISDIN
ncbi:IQ domain-containing protein E isoform X2 [Parasteatoda tepidariorum]|nr:uncharacterized protein LOC107438746 isoform X2 [Parasteatoda tepidariorum]